MPFKSEAQRRFMYAQHPEIAKRWSKETKKGKKLPKKITDSDPKETIKNAAERSYAKDFLGGIDPFGTFTTNYGVADADMSEDDANLRRRVGIAGGLIGGGTVVPSAIYGLIGAGKNVAKGPRAMASGFAQGATGFYKDIYGGLKSAKTLGRIRSGENVPLNQVDDLASFAERKMGVTRRGTTSQQRSALENLSPEKLVELQQRARAPASDGLASLALSGSIGATAAHLGYNKGRDMGAAMTPEDRSRVTGGVRPGAVSEKLKVPEVPNVKQASLQLFMLKRAEKWAKAELEKTTFPHYEKEMRKESGIKDVAGKVMEYGKALPGRIKGKLDSSTYNLRGANVRDILEAEHSKVMGMPAVRRINPKYVDSTESFTRQALLGNKRMPVVEELHNPGGGRKALINQMLASKDLVRAEQDATRKARFRLGAGVLGVGGLAAGAASEMSKQSEVDPETAALGAGAAGATAPIAHGLHSGALRLKDQAPQMSVEDLRKNLKPGDIILSGGSGQGQGSLKPQAALVGADPVGYHAQVVTRVPNKSGSYEIREANPGYKGGGGARKAIGTMSPDWNYRVLRLKDEAEARSLMEEVARRGKADDALYDTLGQQARRQQYASGQNVKSGLKSLLPKALSNKLDTSPLQAGEAVCSSLPGQGPVCFKPGVRGKDVMPHDLMSSKKVTQVGRYVAENSKYDKALKAAPWLVRAGIGAGLGYGAYKGTKALAEKFQGKK